MNYSRLVVLIYLFLSLHSAMGIVTLLSGEPKEGVLVEARSELKSFYEETVTDSSGSYRLRGLHPDTTYTIKVARKSGFDTSTIERASPDSVVVQVSSKIQWHNRNFLCFRFRTFI